MAKPEVKNNRLQTKERERAVMIKNEVKVETQNLKYINWNTESKTQHPKPGTWNLKLKLQNLKTWNPKL